MKGQISVAARAEGLTPRDYSANVWAGIRETIKETDQLFGTPFRGSALTSESKSYDDILFDVVRDKAQQLGISVQEMERQEVRELQ